MSLILTLTLALSAHVPLQSGELADLPQRWEQAREQLFVPGLAVAVVRGDETLLLQGFGTRDVEFDEPVTTDTVFYIASITKTHLTTGMMKLVDQGKVDLDAPVKSYLERLQLPDKELTASISVRDLLSHRWGLNAFPIVFLDAYTGEITEDRYFHFLADASIAGHTQYSNVNITLAGRVLEAASGMHWRDYLAKHVFKPAGMTVTTGYADDMYAGDDVAFPTTVIEGSFAPHHIRKTNRTMHAAGGLGTSAHDMAQWMKLHLNGGKVDGQQIIQPASAQAMQQLTAELPEPAGDETKRRLGFGLSWFIGEYRGYKMIEHGGGYVGSAALLTMLPDENIGVAVLANTDDNGHRMCQAITAEVLDHLLGVESDDPWPDVLRQGANAGAGDPFGGLPGKNPADGGLTLATEAYVGRFENEFWGSIEIEIEYDLLFARMGDMRVTLATRGPDLITARLAAGGDAEGAFIVEAGQVTAVVLDIASDGSVRFERE